MPFLVSFFVSSVSRYSGNNSLLDLCCCLDYLELHLAVPRDRPQSAAERSRLWNLAHSRNNGCVVGDMRHHLVAVLLMKTLRAPLRQLQCFETDSRVGTACRIFLRCAAARDRPQSTAERSRQWDLAYSLHNECVVGDIRHQLVALLPLETLRAPL